MSAVEIKGHDNKTQNVFNILVESYSKTLGDCKSAESIDIMTIITRAMSVAASFKDISGLEKKDIVVTAIKALFNIYIPLEITSNPLFVTLVTNNLDTIIDKLYWAAKQGTGFFNNKGSSCSCW
jgi:hypothetical protein